jgi:hypothetical protein
MFAKLLGRYSDDVVSRKNRRIRPAAGQGFHTRRIHQFADFPDSRWHGATGTFGIKVIESGFIHNKPQKKEGIKK